MPRTTAAVPLSSFATFGEMLKFLRRRARLTQRELSIAAGYSEAQISRLERNERLPDLAALLALIVPALDLQDEPETVARLLELAAVARGEGAPDRIAFERTVAEETHEEKAGGPLGNLPLPLTTFIGRERELATVARLLSVSRLVTLTGAGGCGKTRLALQAARQAAPYYDDGAWWVELAPLSDPELILPTVAAVFQLRQEAGRPLAHTLTESLRHKQLLLVLDNCEHLIEGCAHLAITLLQSCPHLRILSSSRETLGIDGELPMRIPPLGLPDPRRRPALDELAGYEAVQLFSERAAVALPGFSLTAANAPFVTQICRRLDGMPLALELAAARVRLLPVDEIAGRLHDRFRLLTGGSRTARPRQQTLRALIDWSYDLLSAPERALLQRLSVFAGGWTLAAAEAVCAGEQIPQQDILDLLSQLVNKSLVVADREQGQATRYSLLETIRQYAGEKLRQAGAEAQSCRQRLAYFLQLAETAGPELRGHDQLVWLDRMEAELDNLRVSLEWALANEPLPALQLAGALAWFWNMRSYLGEGREWLEKALALPGADSYQAARARALKGLGMLAWCQGELTAAQPALEEAVALFRQTGDKYGLAEALYWLAMVLSDQGRRQPAYQAAQESRSTSQEAGDRWLYALALVILGHLVYARSDPATAQRYLETSVEIFRQVGDLSNLSYAQANLASVLARRGNFGQAALVLEEALALAERTGDRLGTAWISAMLGEVAQEQGQYELAQMGYQEALARFRTLGARSGQASAESGLGEIALIQGDYERARRHFAGSLALFQATGEQRAAAYQLQHLAHLALKEARSAEAVDLLRQSLATAVDLELEAVQVTALEVWAGAWLAEGKVVPAVSLLGLAATWRAAAQATRSAVAQAMVDGFLTAARAQLDETTFARAWLEGEEITLAEAMAFTTTVQIGPEESGNDRSLKGSVAG